MRLKIVTTSLVIAGVIMLVIWPFVVGPKPSSDAGRHAMALYGIRALAYFAVTSLTWLSVAICSWLVIRQTRREFVDEAKENARGLVEGTLRDHGREG